MRSTTLPQLAAYGISMPTFAVPPKLAKETVYMPSTLAAQLLGQWMKREESREGGKPAKG